MATSCCRCSNDAVVETGWVSQQAFLAGYGAAQAVPGPLFTFSAYLGAIQEPSPNGIAGAAIALGAIFLPSFLLLGAVLPLWAAARERVVVQAAVAGIGAAVVGLLAAALWDPVLRTAVHGVGDVAFAVVLFGLLRILPPWAVVGVAAAAGAVLLAHPAMATAGQSLEARRRRRSQVGGAMCRFVRSWTAWLRRTRNRHRSTCDAWSARVRRRLLPPPGPTAPAEAIEAALEVLHDELGGAGVAAFVVEHGRLWSVGVRGYAMIPDGLPLDEGVIGRAVRTSEIQLVLDTTTDPDFVQVSRDSRLGARDPARAADGSRRRDRHRDDGTAPRGR